MGLGIPEMMAIGGGVGLLTGGLRGGVKGAALGGLGGGLGNYVKYGSFLQNAAAQPIANAAVAAGEAPFAGAVFNPSTGTWLNPEFYAGTTTPFATYKGGEGLLANATSGLLNNIPDYVTPQNVLGAANILSNIQPQQPQLPTAPGGMRQGSTQGLNVNMGMAQPIKRRGYA